MKTEIPQKILDMFHYELTKWNGKVRLLKKKGHIYWYAFKGYPDNEDVGIPNIYGMDERDGTIHIAEIGVPGE